jgi:carbon-monoxide dehydrogenase medium subunit
VLAGGQSLLAMMNFRLARPEVLIDIGACGLSGVAVNGALEIGATTTHNVARASDAVRRFAPLLVRALADVGHHAVRNRGTVGGSVAHADPAAEIPAVLLALEGEVVAVGTSGVRTIAAADFFLSYYTTALESDEVLTAIRVSARPPDASGFAEVSRRHGDFALAGAAVAADLSPDREVTNVRVAVFAVADRPLRIPEAEDALRGRRLDDADAVGSAAATAREAVDAVGDVHGSETYRRRMTEVVVRRALVEAGGAE